MNNNKPIIQNNGAKQRHWIATWNNPQGTLEKVFDLLQPRGLVGQEEKGANGTPHFQFYCYFTHGKSLLKLKEFNKNIHWEPCADWAASIKYCQKEESRINGPWTYGTLPKTKEEQGAMGREREQERWKEIRRLGADQALDAGLVAIEQYDRVIKNINLYELRLTQLRPIPRRRKSFWLWGATGLGKTRDITSNFTRFGIYKKDTNKWWEDYKGQPVVYLDEFNNTELGNYLKLWADPFDFNTVSEIKGGSVKLQYEWFFVTSQKSPHEYWGNQPDVLLPLLRRFRVCHYTEKYY